jgi:hypothetical protein
MYVHDTAPSREGESMPRRPFVRPLLAAAILAAAALLAPSAALAQGELEIRALDGERGDPVAVRMHLKDAAGKPVKVPGHPSWNDHFVFQGRTVLKLPNGSYAFEMERGPEYRLRTGSFTITRGSADAKEAPMNRFVDMKKEGWWSGDLHIHRPPADIELLMRAEDLHVAPVITWWNNRNTWDSTPLPAEPLVKFDDNRFFHLMAGEDEREGGAVLYFHLPRPLAIAGSAREYPSPVTFLREAREVKGAHVDCEKPFWWDMPVWVGLGLVDSVGLANNHMQRDGMLATEAWGKPRDKVLYPDPRGNGRWSMDLYMRLLECGVRLPPSAGSASGVLANPVGYNRVYVHCGPNLTYEAWWEGLRAGRVVVTNGPLLRPRVNGYLPGHVFAAAAGETVELDIALNLSTRDEIDYLEILQNGQTVHEVRLEKWAEAGGKLPPVKFTESGWLMVRAVTSEPKTYRFACTGPYYVEIGQKRRVSRSAAKFFVGWIDERMARIKLADAAQREQVLAPQRAARAFWQKLADEATVE